MLIYASELKKGAGFTADKYYSQPAILKNLQHHEYPALTCDGEGNHLRWEMYLWLWCSDRNKSVFARFGAKIGSL